MGLFRNTFGQKKKKNLLVLKRSFFLFIVIIKCEICTKGLGVRIYIKRKMSGG